MVKIELIYQQFQFHKTSNLIIYVCIKLLYSFISVYYNEW